MIFTASDSLSRKSLESLLSDGMEVRVEVSGDIRRCYLDTFDWRLFQAGMVLEVEVRGGLCVLTWREMGSGQIFLTRTVRKIPQRAADFSNAGMQPKLKQIIGSRLLLAHANLQGSVEKLLLLNRDEKTLMRVELRHDKVLSSSHATYLQLQETIYFFPYRGYEQIFRERQSKIVQKGKLLPVVDDPLLSALAVLDITPGAYTGRPQFSLETGQASIVVLGEILNRYLQIMESNVAGAREGKDPEYLHDFLVAVRRIRCFFFMFAPLFPGNKIKLLDSDLQWVQQEATRIRDLDIYINLFQDFETRVDAVHQKALYSLYSFLQSEKQEKLAQMRVALDSYRYLRLTDSMSSYFRSFSSVGELPAGAAAPIEITASNSIYTIYRELVKAAHNLLPNPKAEKIIALYQTSKRLGYHMEIFSSLFPGKRMRQLQSEQGKLQQCLSQYRDVDLQYRRLRDYLSRMTRTQAMREISLEAMEQLIADRKRERKRARVLVLNQIEQFTRKKIRERFKSMFKLPRKSGGT